MDKNLTIFIICASAAFLSGFFYGQAEGRQQALEKAAAAVAARETINHEVDKASAVGLCVALGGLRAECRAALRGLGKSAENQ